MAKPKFQQGDLAVMDGKRQVKILEVHPINAWRPRQGYKVEILGSPGATAETWEDSLEDIPDILETFNWESLCECGSKYVFGMENCHSFWCRSYAKKEESK
jgi:hypothetical protein